MGVLWTQPQKTAFPVKISDKKCTIDIIEYVKSCTSVTYFNEMWLKVADYQNKDVTEKILRGDFPGKIVFYCIPKFMLISWKTTHQVRIFTKKRNHECDNKKIMVRKNARESGKIREKLMLGP